MRAAVSHPGRDLHALPIVAGSAAPETRRYADTVRATALSSTGIFSGVGRPNHDARVRSLRDLDRLIEAASRLRDHLTLEVLRG